MATSPIDTIDTYRYHVLYCILLLTYIDQSIVGIRIRQPIEPATYASGHATSSVGHLGHHWEPMHQETPSIHFYDAFDTCCQYKCTKNLQENECSVLHMCLFSLFGMTAIPCHFVQGRQPDLYSSTDQPRLVGGSMISHD